MLSKNVNCISIAYLTSKGVPMHGVGICQYHVNSLETYGSCLKLEQSTKLVRRTMPANVRTITTLWVFPEWLVFKT